MNAVEQRLIELSIIGVFRSLTQTEAKEYQESRRYVINQAWQRARVLNLMPLAIATRDTDWMTQLKRDYERLR